MSKRIFVKNWSKFQHYKDRSPPWIKLATDTFQNYEFACLQDASKLLALCYWTLAARSNDGSVPDDFEWVKRQCNLGNSVLEEHLQDLVAYGFLVRDSEVLADCKQSACLEGEGEGETEKDINPICAIPSMAPQKSPKPSAYSPAFEAAWADFPARDGGNSKQAAFKAWTARIRSGADPGAMHAGVQRYAAHMTAKGKAGTEFVMQAATFFGPSEHWLQPWSVAVRMRATGDVGVASTEDWM